MGLLCRADNLIKLHTARELHTLPVKSSCRCSPRGRCFTNFSFKLSVSRVTDIARKQQGFRLPVMAHQRRLNQLLSVLTPPLETVGTLKLGDITYQVPASLTPSRLTRSTHLLDVQDPVNLDNLHFMLQKYLLGQDVFLVSQPGPYARRLALTFARCVEAY